MTTDPDNLAASFPIDLNRLAAPFRIGQRVRVRQGDTAPVWAADWVGVDLIITGIMLNQNGTWAIWAADPRHPADESDCDARYLEDAEPIGAASTDQPVVGEARPSLYCFRRYRNGVLMASDVHVHAHDRDEAERDARGLLSRECADSSVARREVLNLHGPEAALAPDLAAPEPPAVTTETIYQALRDYHLSNMFWSEDDGGGNFPLVDLVSAGPTIASGEEELRSLADDLTAALQVSASAKTADDSASGGQGVSATGVDEAVYTEGVCGDGAAILCDGVPVSVTHVLDRLNSTPTLLTQTRREGAEVMRERAIAALEAPITFAYGPRHGIVAKARREFQRAIGRLPSEQPK